MKNISEILNSILQKAADPIAAQKSSLTGSQGLAEDISTFEDVLARLATQAQDQKEAQTPGAARENVLSTPAKNSSLVSLPESNNSLTGAPVNSASLFEASVSRTQVDIQVMGTAPVDGFSEWDLQKLEQSILSMATGLAKLLNLVSNLQDLQTGQAQELLSSIGNGKISQTDIDQLLSQVSVFNQNTDPSLNPLSLSASQQASWLAQMLQNMLQNQQLVLAPNQNNLQTDQVSAIGSGGKSAVYGMSLQFVFTDTEILQYQQSSNRQSVFAMDLHTMTLNMASVSAFAGDSIPLELTSGSPSLLSSDAVNRLTQLLSDLQVKPNPEPLLSVSATANTSNISSALMQNFKDLVQMLSRAGASQVILSTLINQQKELSTSDLKQAFFQAPSLTELLKSLESALRTSVVKPVEPALTASRDLMHTGGQTALPLLPGGLSSDAAGMRLQLTQIDSMVARLNLMSLQGSGTEANAPEKSVSPQLLMSQLIEQISNYRPLVEVSQSQTETQPGVSTVLNNVNAPQARLLMEQFLIEVSQFQQTVQLQSSPAGNNNNLQPQYLAGMISAGPQPQELLGVFAANSAQSVNNPVLINTLAETAAPALTIPQANSAVQNLSSTIATAIALANTQPAAAFGKTNESAGPNIPGSGSVVPMIQPMEAQAVVPAVSTTGSATQMELTMNSNSMTNLAIMASGKTIPQDNDGMPVIPLASTLFLNPSSLSAETTKIAALGGNTAGANIIQDNSVTSLLIARQVADQIASHADKSQVVSRLSFQLIPESLGRVTVQIVLIDQTMSARITVVNPVVKDSLDHHMIELRTALNQAGLQINQLEVQVQGNSSNLLAQYYQYQQEGFGYQMQAYIAPPTLEGAENLENGDILGPLSVRSSLVDLLV